MSGASDEEEGSSIGQRSALTLCEHGAGYGVSGALAIGIVEDFRIRDLATSDLEKEWRTWDRGTSHEGEALLHERPSCGTVLVR